MKTFIALIALAFLFICVVDATNEEQVYPRRSRCVNNPLGMQSGAISDCQISASSYYDKRYVAWEARLDTDSYGWTPKTLSQAVGSWLQVDLLTVHTIRGVATQGSKYNNEWMKTYSLQYSDDGRYFQDYEGGRVYRGNTDRNTINRNILSPNIRARYIRVLPKTWNSWPSIRMELYECK